MVGVWPGPVFNPFPAPVSTALPLGPHSGTYRSHVASSSFGELQGKGVMVRASMGNALVLASWLWKMAKQQANELASSRWACTDPPGVKFCFLPVRKACSCVAAACQPCSAECSSVPHSAGLAQPLRSTEVGSGVVGTTTPLFVLSTTDGSQMGLYPGTITAPGTQE